MELSAERWERMTATDRTQFAERLVRQLPSGFSFGGVRLHEYCGQKRNVASFEKEGSHFVLIPGGQVSLGYDERRQFAPDANELDSWRETAEEYGIDLSLQEYIIQATLRVRSIEFAPMLIESAPGELGWQSIDCDDGEVKSIVREYPRQKHIDVSRNGTTTRVLMQPDGTIVASRSISRTHADLAAMIAAAGFRLPTSDEWEYACGGGSGTLFRWGDHVPCDRYPTDISPAEAEWNRQWALSGGTLQRPAAEFVSDWNYHRAPNAFGLLIAADPYKSELVREIGVTRGGDGGSTICGGAGFFIGWMTLATAYFEEHSCRHDPDEPIDQGYTVGRRVLELY